MISSEKHCKTREELSLELLRDKQFIGCLAYFLQFLKQEEESRNDKSRFITPNELAGMTAADKLLRTADLSKQVFRSHEELMLWIGPQLVNIVPEFGLVRGYFTREDVELLTQGLLGYMSEGLLGLEGFSPIKPVNQLPNMLNKKTEL